MKIISILFFALFMFSPEITSNKTIDTESPSEFLNKLESQYGEETLNIAFFSIEELRPYSILQNEATVSKYSNKWVTPAEYLSLLDESEKNELDSSVSKYIQDFELDRKQKVYSKIIGYLYTYTIFENLFIANDNNYKLKIFKALRQMQVTRTAFEHISTLGEFTSEDIGSVELNQAKVKAYNNISNLDEQSRLIYYSEFFKNLSKM